MLWLAEYSMAGKKFTPYLSVAGCGVTGSLPPRLALAPADVWLARLTTGCLLPEHGKHPGIGDVSHPEKLIQSQLYSVTVWSATAFSSSISFFDNLDCLKGKAQWPIP